jgi:hypothetical protein
MIRPLRAEKDYSSTDPISDARTSCERQIVLCSITAQQLHNPPQMLCASEKIKRPSGMEIGSNPIDVASSASGGGTYESQDRRPPILGGGLIKCVVFVSVQNLEGLGLTGGGKYLATAYDRIYLVGIAVD